ncbi:MAG: enoyl-CoA hydratase/isomerase [Pseudomonadota bacterium]|jgi:polyketide biosynthesis enoyl-CoA hydratase PksH
MDMMTHTYQTISVRLDAEVCTITLARPEHGNTISRTLVEEIGSALDACEASAKIVVLQGSPEVFCLGADFQGIQRDLGAGAPLRDHVPGPMYDLWQRLARGPLVSVAHVRGKVNAGGVGFVAACDVVLSDETAMFTLSEMLFGLIPACVMPFLLRRIGAARANYLTVSAQALPARLAEQWGLVDACEANSDSLLRKHLLRLKRLGKPAIANYKHFAAELDGRSTAARALALQTNLAAFSDPVNLEHISRYVATGRFPWEAAG